MAENGNLMHWRHLLMTIISKVYRKYHNYAWNMIKIPHITSKRMLSVTFR